MNLSRLSLDEVVKVAQLAPENMKRLFDLIRPPAKGKEKRTLLPPKAVQEIEGATEKIQEIRERLRQKRR